MELNGLIDAKEAENNNTSFYPIHQISHNYASCIKPMINASLKHLGCGRKSMTQGKFTVSKVVHTTHAIKNTSNQKYSLALKTCLLM